MVNRLKLLSTATIIICGYTIFFNGLNETNIKYKNKFFNKEKSTTVSLDTDVEEILETKLKNNINKSETKNDGNVNNSRNFLCKLKVDCIFVRTSYIIGKTRNAIDITIIANAPPITTIGESLIPFASSPKKVSKPACDEGICPLLSFFCPLELM